MPAAVTAEQQEKIDILLYSSICNMMMRERRTETQIVNQQQEARTNHNSS